MLGTFYWANTIPGTDLIGYSPDQVFWWLVGQSKGGTLANFNAMQAAQNPGDIWNAMVRGRTTVHVGAWISVLNIGVATYAKGNLLAPIGYSPSAIFTVV